MGLFDSFRESVTPTFDVQRAVMTIAVAAVLADGDVSNEEIRRLRSLCILSPIFSNNSDSQDQTVIEFAANIFNQLGNDAVVQASNSLNPELKETAFAFACDMILADGIVGNEEETFLNSLMQTLQIPENNGRSLVWATLVRNRK